MKIGIGSLIVAACAALLWLGCEEECSDCRTSPPVQEIGSVEISFGYEGDTLFFPDGETFLPFLVIAKGLDGMPRAGEQVDIALLNPSFGAIEFSNSNLRDTTNSDGFILAGFQAYGRAGTQTITASAGGQTDSQTIVIRETDGPVANLTLWATPSALEANGNEIAVSTITAVITDASNRGIAGSTILFTANGGELTDAPPTDQNGQTQCYWIADNIFGVFLIEAQYGPIIRVVQVSVTEDPGVPSFYVSASSNHFEADSAHEVNVLVTAVLRDSFYQGVAHEPIILSGTGGSVEDSCVTNSNGVCQFVWTFLNEFGIFRLAAEYEPWGLRDTLMVEVVYTP